MGTVLVVDNEPALRDLIRLNLEMDGHAVITAASGAEALDLALRRRPDLVILDVMMPHKSGWQVLAEMKAADDRVLADTPVILLTARRDDMARIRAGIEGALRYLTKPFSAAEVRMEVTAALSGGPEPARRRKVQTEALEQLARLESGLGPAAGPPPARPHITRLGRSGPGRAPVPRVAPAKVAALSAKQRELMAAVGATSTVSEAAQRLEVSRSNVYASLRRIVRKLDVPSVPELLTLLRSGDLPVT